MPVALTSFEDLRPDPYDRTCVLSGFHHHNPHDYSTEDNNVLALHNARHALLSGPPLQLNDGVVLVAMKDASVMCMVDRAHYDFFCDGVDTCTTVEQ